MKKTLILVGFLALAPFAKGQLLLEALEGGIPFTPSEKCLERVYDKYYGDGEHNFIYCAVQGPNGKKWLNLNLGAEYAKESSPHFNPEATPTGNNDILAFGSLFHYGRDADGHELVEYESTSDYWYVKPKYGIKYMSETADTDKNWISGWNYNATIDRSNAWTGLNLNNPCPNGYQVMSVDDIKSFPSIGNDIATDLQTTVIMGRTIPYHINLIFAPTVRSCCSSDEMTNNRVSTLTKSGVAQVSTSSMFVIGNKYSDEIWPGNYHLTVNGWGQLINYDQLGLKPFTANVPYGIIDWGYGGIPYEISDNILTTYATAIRCVEK